ncbi:MAG TPA: homoserine O-succinyltransferase [Polyangiaceae bacterium]|jgi:homoserine trans-succinylase|nr:homoserine O-succinyltransferase [Polyangiaceae bacterium]
MAPQSVSHHATRTNQRSGVRHRGLPETVPLRVGVLGLSHEPVTSLIEPLSRAALPVHPIRIRLGTAATSGTDASSANPVSFTRAILDEPLDGLVLVGDPDGSRVSDGALRELGDILDYARGFVPSTLGLGEGALLLATALGLETERLDGGLRGLVPQRVLTREHALVRGSGEVFFSVEERRSRITDGSIDRAVAARTVIPLAHSRDGGVSLFESADGHLGRLERPPARLPSDDRLSAFLDSARESARAHAGAFFASWVRRVYESSRRAVTLPK